MCSWYKGWFRRLLGVPDTQCPLSWCCQGSKTFPPTTSFTVNEGKSSMSARQTPISGCCAKRLALLDASSGGNGSTPCCQSSTPGKSELPAGSKCANTSEEASFERIACLHGLKNGSAFLCGGLTSSGLAEAENLLRGIGGGGKGECWVGDIEVIGEMG